MPKCRICNHTFLRDICDSCGAAADSRPRESKLSKADEAELKEPTVRFFGGRRSPQEAGDIGYHGEYAR